MAYQLDHEGRMERERLRDLESLFDPITIERLDKVGVDEGWQCLELGAGGGSIVEWLCQRVGKWGRVVAADLQTKFLETIDASNLEIRQHDVRTDPLETSAYDLIHARALVEHLPERDELIGKLVAALKPGGRLLIESGDYASFVSVEGDPHGLFERAWSRFFDVLVAAGFDLYYGRRLGIALRAGGLKDVQFEGRVLEWGGTRRGTGTWLYLFQRFRDKIVAAGALSSSEADEFIALVEHPSFSAMTPIFYGAYGRRPG